MPLSRRRSRRKARSVVIAALTTVLTAALVSVATATPARAATRSDVLQAAAAYARQQGYHVGIAVLDTRTGVLRGAGYWTGIFASESLIKVFIATRLLHQHRMHGSTAQRAWKMITQSDDAIASAFYGSVGGDNLINWMKARYHVPDLGYPPSQPGWWGNTHLRPSGLVKLYAKLKRDPVVAPWLLNAMRHAKPYGSDGTYQFFGIPSATHGFAVKQGWGNDYEIGSSADFNTTGFIAHNRYAIAILARGPSYTYGSAIGSLLTNVARRLLPGGAYPDPQPKFVSMSPHIGATAGGTRVTVHGTDLTHVTKVMFGDKRGRDLQVMSPTMLLVTAPPHTRATTFLMVYTTHGRTFRNASDKFLFERAPALTSLSKHMGRAAGGDAVIVRGRAFTPGVRVLFGKNPAASVTRVSRQELKVVSPKGAPGVVNVRVTTPYGRAPIVPAGRFAYAGVPTISSLDHTSGPVAGGNTVTITGTAFQSGSQVSFGSQPATVTSRHGTTQLVVTVPAGNGSVGVVVTTPYGRSRSVPYTYTT